MLLPHFKELKMSFEKQPLVAQLVERETVVNTNSRNLRVRSSILFGRISFLLLVSLNFFHCVVVLLLCTTQQDRMVIDCHFFF